MDGRLIELNAFSRAAREKFIPVMRESTAVLLENTVREAMPKRILEIGTSIGTSGIRCLLAAENARLTTIEIDLDTAEEAKKNFIRFGVQSRAEILVGDCREVMRMLNGRFDFVIIDGPKGHYKEIAERAVSLMPDGGIIFADDTGFHGKIEGGGLPGHKHRTIVNNMREFIDYITGERFETELYGIDDGVAVAKLRGKGGRSD